MSRSCLTEHVPPLRLQTCLDPISLGCLSKSEQTSSYKSATHLGVSLRSGVGMNHIKIIFFVSKCQLQLFQTFRYLIHKITDEFFTQTMTCRVINFQNYYLKSFRQLRSVFFLLQHSNFFATVFYIDCWSVESHAIISTPLHANVSSINNNAT